KQDGTLADGIAALLRDLSENPARRMQMAQAARALAKVDAAERIADDLGLTPADREEMLPSGRQRLLHNRIHWAKFYMSKAGLVTSPKRGRFIATDAGRDLLASNPVRLGVNELKDYKGFREFYSGQKSADDGAPPAAIVPSTETGTPEE
ncbi:winged helix-turn-helix domain-containing protein, partial [Escherichia coli]|uniref:winged helix-turn-helix domain-containing protein n=1 Tax=Escherichia coli TaxID=562 RepID=UPI00227FBC93